MCCMGIVTAAEGKRTPQVKELHGDYGRGKLQAPVLHGDCGGGRRMLQAAVLHKDSGGSTW